MSNLFTRAHRVIIECDPKLKVALTHALRTDWECGNLSEVDFGIPVEPIDDPGRPVRPVLVDPKLVPKRNLTTVEGQAALVHAITHIEFNAINLATDAVYRFRGMPREYYSDWVRVADEEASHFELLNARLNELGYHYGDFEAHEGLWSMARKTRDDVLERMALVPRVLEAKGLDATPRIVQRLRALGDSRTVSILEDVIYRDEIDHVRVGNHWFRYCCAERNLDPQTVFARLLEEHMGGRLRGPFNFEARALAGFTESDMQMLRDMPG